MTEVRPTITLESLDRGLGSVLGELDRLRKTVKLVLILTIIALVLQASSLVIFWVLLIPSY